MIVLIAIKNQGDDPSKFKATSDNGFLSYHKSKKLLADGLKFMDTLKANPHNSAYDGPTLYCDECHEHEIPQWMWRVTPWKFQKTISAYILYK